MTIPFSAGKRPLALAALATLTLLAACNGGSDKADSTPAAPAGKSASSQAGSSQSLTITFWHSMDGELGKTLQGIVDDFNKANPQYHVNAVFKGSYKDSMNAAIAAYRAKQAPDIVQVFEVGTATMMYSGGAIKPVQSMSEEVGDPIDPKAFVGAVAGYYSTPDGKLVSMPFNSSTPVLYYNKDLFKKAGLDPEKAPKTWAELREAAKKLKASGAECGYTTTWPAWILMENFAAWHNIPYASDNNGFGGLGARLQLDNPLFKRLFGDLAAMSKEGSFTYGGRGDAASSLFISGKCGIFTGSSGSRADIAKNGKFSFGISQLPYYQDVQGAPQNSIIGGASLWVFDGKDKNTYTGVTKFLKYLASSEVNAKWHQATGYVPVVKAAYDLSKQQGFYDKNPGADVPIKQLSADTTDQSRGVRLGSLPDIREVEEGAMEKIFNGSTPPEAALADMQKQGNEILQKFQDDHK